MFKNYVFDLYGTLLNIRTDENLPELWEKFAQFYKFHGADFSPEELKAAFETECKTLSKDSTYKYPEIQLEYVFQNLFKKKGVELSIGECVTAGQFFRILSTVQYVSLYPGVKDLLCALRKKGKKLYVLSNAQKIFTWNEMVATGIEKSFDGIIFSSDYGCAKPDPEFYGILNKKYGLIPEETIMIGNDPETDIEGGKRAGLHTLYIHSNISPQGKPAPEADFIIPDGDFTKIKELILK